MISHVIEMLLQGGGGVTDAQFRPVCVRSFNMSAQYLGLLGRNARSCFFAHLSATFKTQTLRFSLRSQEEYRQNYPELVVSVNKYS